jgi:hypothetical protein
MLNVPEEMVSNGGFRYPTIFGQILYAIKTKGATLDRAEATMEIPSKYFQMQTSQISTQ